MARIRSIHPGLFTDEAFVSLSAEAQVLWIGLWCEADDQGVFEWKPTMLKMRILPASTARIDPLLAELEQRNCIKPYTEGGRQYGVIRNFVRHQRPKSPKEVHPLPAKLRNYAGFTSGGLRPNATTGRKRFGSGSEQDDHSDHTGFGTSSELKAPYGGPSSENGDDDSELAWNEFGTSSEVVPNAALRCRMEDVGCRTPSRDRTVQDVAQGRRAPRPTPSYGDDAFDHGLDSHGYDQHDRDEEFAR